jgi:thiol:disulfide interchange protein
VLTSVQSEELAAIIRKDKKPALVLFQGSWCGDCKAFEPTWDRWISGKKAPIFRIDVPRGGEEWKEWALDEIPTIASYSGGAEKGRVHGVITESDLNRLWKMIGQDR